MEPPGMRGAGAEMRSMCAPASAFIPSRACKGWGLRWRRARGSPLEEPGPSRDPSPMLRTAGMGWGGGSAQVPSCARGFCRARTRRSAWGRTGWRWPPPSPRSPPVGFASPAAPSEGSEASYLVLLLSQGGIGRCQALPWERDSFPGPAPWRELGLGTGRGPGRSGLEGRGAVPAPHRGIRRPRGRGCSSRIALLLPESPARWTIRGRPPALPSQALAFPAVGAGARSPARIAGGSRGDGTLAAPEGLAPAFPGLGRSPTRAALLHGAVGAAEAGPQHRSPSTSHPQRLTWSKPKPCPISHSGIQRGAET